MCEVFSFATKIKIIHKNKNEILKNRTLDKKKLGRPLKKFILKIEFICLKTCNLKVVEFYDKTINIWPINATKQWINVPKCIFFKDVFFTSKTRGLLFPNLVPPAPDLDDRRPVTFASLPNTLVEHCL